jgi:hypothetical protein
MNEILDAATKAIASSQEHTRALYNLVGAKWPMNQVPEEIARAAASLMRSASETEARIVDLSEKVRLELRSPSEVAAENEAADLAERSSHRPVSR